MKKIMIGLTAAAVLIAVGCALRTEHVIDARITIDIRHIEQQAESVLDFIEGEAEQLPAIEAAETSAESSRIGPFLKALYPIRQAHASELKEDSPRIKEIAVQLRERFPRIEALKRQGIIGENDRGYVELRRSEALQEDTERKEEIQKLIQEENKDRRDLYTEIVRLNQDQEGLSLTVVERTYARKRLERARPGEYFRLPPAGRDFEEFRRTLRNKQVEGKVEPQEWIRITAVRR